MIHINDQFKELKPSDTIVINQRSLERIKQGRSTYRLGFGQSPFPVPEVVQEPLRQNAHQKDYLPVQGLAALREIVAEDTNRHTGQQYTGDEVFIGPGSKELIFLIQSVLSSPLILPSPS